MNFLDYIKGIRRGKDAHCIEKNAMVDPFLSEALEGYDSVKGNHAQRLTKIQHLVQKRSHRPHRGMPLWQVVAACLVGLMVGGSYLLFYYPHDSSLAMQKTDLMPEATIELYVPAINPDKQLAAHVQCKTNIVNLDEFVSSHSQINIYVPETYLKKKKILKGISTNITNLNEVMKHD